MSKVVDLTGEVHNEHTVLEKLSEKKGSTFLYLCKCSCGTLVKRTANELRGTKAVKSCGCLKRRSRPKDFTGQVFGRLTAIRNTGVKSPNRDYIWEFLCTCGNYKELPIGQVNTTKSCGCLHKETMGNLERCHHMKNTSTYTSWRKLKERCNNTPEKDKDYYNKAMLPDSWNTSFKSFLEDMGEKPSPDHTLDRIDNEKGYSKDNCRWANSYVQSRNRSGFRNTSSQFKGVCLEKSSGKWVAYISVGEKKSKIGRYTDEIIAAAAYNLASLLIFEGFEHFLSLNKEVPRELEDKVPRKGVFFTSRYLELREEAKKYYGN